jgi:hypothetical protein
VENRTWAPPQRLVGQRIAIHAALRIDQAAVAAAAEAGFVLPDPLPTGVLVGTVRLVGVHHASTCRSQCSAWAQPGVQHWELADPRPLHRPLPCIGRQRLWTVAAELASRLPV